MKILMIHPHDIYAASEPWTIRIIEIARRFVKKGHKVKLIYFPLPENERGTLKSGLIKEFETIPFNRRRWALPYNIHRILKYVRWADVVHFQKCFAHAALPALFGAYLFGKPVHYDWDDHEYAIYNFQPPSYTYGLYLNFIEQKMPKLVDSISYASNKIRELALSLGFDEEFMREAHVGANLEFFNPKVNPENILNKYGIDKKKHKLVIYVGQLQGGQYAEMLVRAAKILLDKRDDVRFMIVGGGFDLQRLKHIAHEELCLGEKFVFTGFVVDDEIPKLLKEADVAVACFEDNKITRAKSPLKVAEYLAAGKAIVASNVGEVPFMLAGNGVLTKPGDINDLARGIEFLLDNPKIRKKLEINARKRAEEAFNWEITANNILELYHKILNY
ncbi:MAG: glycosyltransferase family 4 protein [Candidatus Woesearchaeota archaeon]